MASKYLIKNVSPGTTEYLANVTFAPADPPEELVIEFNNEITIDDIVTTITAGDTSDYELLFVYPSSGPEALIKQVTGEPFFLNSAQESGSGISPHGKLWYHIPARTKLVVRSLGNIATSTQLEVTIIGRGG